MNRQPVVHAGGRGRADAGLGRDRQVPQGRLFLGVATRSHCFSSHLIWMVLQPSCISRSSHLIWMVLHPSCISRCAPPRPPVFTSLPCCPCRAVRVTHPQASSGSRSSEWPLVPTSQTSPRKVEWEENTERSVWTSPPSLLLSGRSLPVEVARLLDASPHPLCPAARPRSPSQTGTWTGQGLSGTTRTGHARLAERAPPGALLPGPSAAAFSHLGAQGSPLEASDARPACLGLPSLAAGLVFASWRGYHRVHL